MFVRSWTRVSIHVLYLYRICMCALVIIVDFTWHIMYDYLIRCIKFRLFDASNHRLFDAPNHVFDASNHVLLQVSTIFLTRRAVWVTMLWIVSIPVDACVHACMWITMLYTLNIPMHLCACACMCAHKHTHKLYGLVCSKLWVLAMYVVCMYVCMHVYMYKNTARIVSVTKRVCYQTCLLPNVSVTKRFCYQTCLLPNVSVTKRVCYQTCLLPNVSVTKHVCYQTCVLPNSGMRESPLG
jgi:hypothetical protein